MSDVQRPGEVGLLPRAAPASVGLRTPMWSAFSAPAMSSAMLEMRVDWADLDETRRQHLQAARDAAAEAWFNQAAQCKHLAQKRPRDEEEPMHVMHTLTSATMPVDEGPALLRPAATRARRLPPEQQLAWLGAAHGLTEASYDSLPPPPTPQWTDASLAGIAIGREHEERRFVRIWTDDEVAEYPLLAQQGPLTWVARRNPGVAWLLSL